MSAARRLPRARHEHLLRELELRGSVRASVIAEELGVTEVTIRRDIIALEQDGHLARVHGGAISARSRTRPSSARSLVGMVLPGSGSHYPDVVRGAEAASHALRARVVLATTNYRAAVEREQVERLVGLGVEGLILAPTLRGRTAEDLVDLLDSVPVPVVLIERSLEGSTELARHDWVRTDQVRGTVLALEHLAALGHTAVGLALLDRTPPAPSIREGYALAVARLGLTPVPVRSLPKDDGGDDDPADDALREFLADCRARGVRAVLVHTDHHASRLLEIALDQGIRVPEELAIVAHDDEFAAYGIVPLTAVSPPGREIGRLALATLFERIRAEDPALMPPRHVLLVPHLEIRRSCGAAAGQRSTVSP